MILKIDKRVQCADHKRARKASSQESSHQAGPRHSEAETRVYRETDRERQRETEREMAINSSLKEIKTKKMTMTVTF